MRRYMHVVTIALEGANSLHKDQGVQLSLARTIQQTVPPTLAEMQSQEREDRHHTKALLHSDSTYKKYNTK